MKIKFIIFSIVFLIFGLFITSDSADRIFGTRLIDEVYHLFVWSLAFVPLGLISLILKDQNHKFWLKFTGVFFLVSMLIVFMLPEYDRGLVSVDRELANWFFVGLYSFISIIYFFTQFLKKSK